ncbi:MAG: hypothetical protein V7721_12605 [Porticoccaceae bacterium]
MLGVAGKLYIELNGSIKEKQQKKTGKRYRKERYRKNKLSPNSRFNRGKTTRMRHRGKVAAHAAQLTSNTQSLVRAFSLRFVVPVGYSAG